MPENPTLTQPRARRGPTFAALALIPALLSACALRDVATGDPCRSPANEIVAENCLEGHPATEWDINGYGDPSIQGFGTDIAIAQGEFIDLKIDTDSDGEQLDAGLADQDVAGRSLATIGSDKSTP